MLLPMLWLLPPTFWLSLSAEQALLLLYLLMNQQTLLVLDRLLQNQQSGVTFALLLLLPLLLTLLLSLLLPLLPRPLKWIWCNPRNLKGLRNLEVRIKTTRLRILPLRRSLPKPQNPMLENPNKNVRWSFPAISVVMTIWPIISLIWRRCMVTWPKRTLIHRLQC